MKNNETKIRAATKNKNQKGETKMTRTNKFGWTLAAALIALGCLGTEARADRVPGNNSGTFSVRIFPNVDLGVSVNTSGAAWVGSADLDVTANLGGQEVLGTPVTLTILGDFNNQELTLLATKIDTWSLDEDTAARETDALQLFALVGADQTAILATIANYETSTNNHLITTAPLPVGQTNGNEGTPGTGHLYEFDASVGGLIYDDVDNMIVGTVRMLWLGASIPTATSVDSQQEFQITVAAASGVTQ